jgi:hypothetical protein
MGDYVEVDGHPTWVEQRGGGEETVLLLHGGLSNSDLLLDVIGDALAAQYRGRERTGAGSSRAARRVRARSTRVTSTAHGAAVMAPNRPWVSLAGPALNSSVSSLAVVPLPNISAHRPSIWTALPLRLRRVPRN